MQLNASLTNESSDSNPFILPFSFIITSFFALLIFSITLILNPTALAPNLARLPAGLSLAHLFILGWASMLAMGAIYQLIAVVTQRSIYSNRLGFIHFGFYSVGVLGLYISLGSFHLIGMIVFGTLTVFAVGVFLMNVFITIRASMLKNAVISATTSALLYLGLTVVTGILMVLNFQFSILGGAHQTLLISHLWLGLIGWFLFLIIGYSFKMLPMFYLAHGQREVWQKWILLTLHFCIWVSILGAAIGYTSISLPISLGLLSLSLWLFVLQIKDIQKKRFKKNPGKGITFFVFLVYFFAILMTVSFLVSIINPTYIWNTSVLPLGIVFYVIGFVSISILAYLSKIIPFLWWTFRYGKQVGQGETPSLAVMIDETTVYKKLWILFISLLLFIFGLAIAHSGAIMATSILLALSTIYYLVTIVKAFSY